jgi:flagellar protein FlbD
VIELTRLNGHKLLVNCDLLKCVEASPDTMLSLVTGEKIVVLESCEEVRALAFRLRVSTLEAAWPGAVCALGKLLANNAKQS